MESKRAISLSICLMFAGVVDAGTVTYVYTGPSGSPLMEADSAGQVMATFDYRPYGGLALGTARNGIGFTGHINDADTDFVYMQARYYDPATSRFLSVDPGTSIMSLAGFNRYVYAAGNPLKYIDPSGRVIVIIENPNAPHGGKHNIVNLVATAKADPIAAPIIKALDESDKVHVLIPAGRMEGSRSIPTDVQAGTVGPDGKASSGTGTVIKIQLGNESVKMTNEDGSSKRRTVPILEKLIHEGSHSVDFDQGAMPEKNSEDPVTGNPAGEQGPMNKENEWRQKQDLPGRRTEYELPPKDKQ